VQAGQSLAAGDIIADIETDKATMRWESQDDGIMAKIVLPAGTQDIKLKVGTVAALTVDDESQLEQANLSLKSYQPVSAPAASAPSGHRFLPTRYGHCQPCTQI
jgi:pyruvate/2-oxoglutarate dehydrogenase complex dihydrolipoamide acyltransferase (E2) component